MKATVALTLVLLSGCSAFPARAAETSPLKCGVNEDRVWVYDSLNSYDVAMKLKCGEPVEIIGHEKGYVKIRTSGGREGYVEARAVPKSPTDQNNSSEGETQPGQPERQSVVAAARAKNPANSASDVNAKQAANATSGDATKPAVVVPLKPRGESVDGAVSSAATLPVPVESKAVPLSATALNSKQPDAQSNAAHLPTKPSTNTSTASATKTSNGTGSPAKTLPVRSNKGKSSDSNSADNAASKNSVAKTNSGRTVAVSNSSATASRTSGTATSKTSSSKTVASSKPAAPAPAAAPALPVSNASALADNVPSRPMPSVENIHAATSLRDPDDEEEPLMEPLERKENCNIYFSAYGLSPNQYRWMTQNRGKNFSGICPAPSPSMVDFVVIFTHDADFFNGTMPSPVHTDKNGFSDFTPLTTIDTAVVSPSDADKNRREYVWVFHTKRGTFDPAKFSPRRKPLFSTTESNKIGTAAGSRSAEDALRFIEQQGVIQ